MINKALDLPFDEPQETYSTSEHLFHDLASRRAPRAASSTPRPRARAPATRRRPHATGRASGPHRQRAEPQPAQPQRAGDAAAARPSAEGSGRPPATAEHRAGAPGGSRAAAAGVAAAPTPAGTVRRRRR